MKPSFKRLHVVIAEAGVGSRRYAETLIRDRKVRVNGSVIRVQGMKVDPAHDRIEVNGKTLRFEIPTKKYYLFYKPAGVVTTLKDPNAKRTVQDYFRDVPERLFPAGRLDKDSTGLLLMTNDGKLVHQLTHPRFGVEKNYRVTIDRALSIDTINALQRGIVLEGKRTAPCKIKPLPMKPNRGMELMMTLHEGRKRQIRLMMKTTGASVVRLHREQYGPLVLGDLKPGEKRQLSQEEVQSLKRLVSL